MGKICVYNWTDITVDMGIDNIVHNDREPRHEMIFNAWIKYCESEILIKLDQDNEQHLLHKYKNIRFLDVEQFLIDHETL